MSAPPEFYASHGPMTDPREHAGLLEDLPADVSSLIEYEKRLCGTCRDFTSLTVAMLRHKGVPARARCSFGAYFNPGSLEDHWFVEYWNTDEQHWQLVDAQIDELQRDALRLNFDRCTSRAISSS